MLHHKSVGICVSAGWPSRRFSLLVSLTLLLDLLPDAVLA